MNITEPMIGYTVQCLNIDKLQNEKRAKDAKYRDLFEIGFAF